MRERLKAGGNKEGREIHKRYPHGGRAAAARWAVVAGTDRGGVTGERAGAKPVARVARRGGYADWRRTEPTHVPASEERSTGAGHPARARNDGEEGEGGVAASRSPREKRARPRGRRSGRAGWGKRLPSVGMGRVSRVLVPASADPLTGHARGSHTQPAGTTLWFQPVRDQFATRPRQCGVSVCTPRLQSGTPGAHSSSQL